MVQTRSGKDSHPNDSQVSVLPPEKEHTSNQYSSQELHLVKTKNRRERTSPQYTVDEESVTNALRRVPPQTSTNSSSSKTSSLEVKAQKPGYHAPSDDPVSRSGNDMNAAAVPLENVPSLWDDVGYLAPSFDPLSMKVAMLRNILLRHNIHYDSTSTKKVLVDIFNKEITPRAAATVMAMNNIVPSKDGIVDVNRGDD